MRLNENTAIVGHGLVLAPYRAQHVERYHAWMSDPAIQEATASEPLSIEEEYAMQRSWREDDDKLTFIIHTAPPQPGTQSTQAPLRIDTSTMIGDVNLFLSDATDSDSDDEQTRVAEKKVDDEPQARSKRRRRAEMEIMIAEPLARRQSHALHALQLFLSYAARHLDLSPPQFFARVGTSNLKSIRLFEKLGFERGRVSEVFGEVEMVWPRDATNRDAFAWSDEGEEVQCELDEGRES